MKVRINNNQPNAAQRKALKKECQKEFFKLLENYNKQVSAQIMCILHFEFGFGKKRLFEFFKKLKEMQADYMARYEAIDEEVPDICEIKLKNAGIDLKEFFEFEFEGDE